MNRRRMLLYRIASAQLQATESVLRQAVGAEQENTEKQDKEAEDGQE